LKETTTMADTYMSLALNQSGLITDLDFEDWNIIDFPTDIDD